jgi:hypothetical protein
MPQINATVNFTPSISAEVQWTLGITSNVANLTCTMMCNKTIRSNSWTPEYTACTKSANLVGGAANVQVTACSASATSAFRIVGDNPSKNQIQAEIGSDDTAKKIACQESGQNQFTENEPVVSGTGAVGIMQLTISAGKTCEHIWDWKSNVAQGLSHLNGRRIAAGNHHNTEHLSGGGVVFNQDLRDCKGRNNLPNFRPTPLEANQIEMEAIRRYSSGREHHWEITNQDTCDGRWIRQPILVDDANYVNKVSSKNPSTCANL